MLGDAREKTTAYPTCKELSQLPAVRHVNSTTPHQKKTDPVLEARRPKHLVSHCTNDKSTNDKSTNDKSRNDKSTNDERASEDAC